MPRAVHTAWLLAAVPAAAALALAAVLGARPIGLGVAFVLYLGAFVLPRRLGAFLFLAAAAALALAAPIRTLFHPAAAGWLAVVGLAVAPFFLRLAAAVPHRGLAWFLPLALAVPALFLLHPVAPSIMASDLAPRLQVALLALGTLVALVPVQWATGPRRRQGKRA